MHAFQMPDTIFVRQTEGFENLCASLKLHLKGPSKTIGIVVDSDVFASQRWQQISDRIREHKMNVLPASPTKGGTIIECPDIGKRLGIWLMPDNSSSGILEDFVNYFIPEGDSLLSHARNSTKAAKMDFGAAFNDRDEPKAIIHSWLAWQKDPGLQIGTAIKARFLDPNCPTAFEFIAWLKRLYDLQPVDMETI